MGGVGYVVVLSVLGVLLLLLGSSGGMAGKIQGCSGLILIGMAMVIQVLRHVGNRM